jgi:hypothetical protein
MARKEEWDRDSLAWIHRIREEHYHQTKSQRLEDWLRPVELEKAARDCRRLGVKVKPVEARRRKVG